MFTEGKLKLFRYFLHCLSLISSISNIKNAPVLVFVGCIFIQRSWGVTKQDFYSEPQRGAGAGARQDQHLIVSPSPRSHWIALMALTASLHHLALLSSLQLRTFVRGR